MMMSRCPDDHSLVQAYRAGRTEAFEVLVKRYQERLYPTILRLVGSAEDAEDILQDTFVRAFEKLDQFQGESSFYTWIYRIAVNLALSGHRRSRIRSRSDASAPAPNVPGIRPGRRVVRFRPGCPSGAGRTRAHRGSRTRSPESRASCDRRHERF